MKLTTYLLALSLLMTTGFAYAEGRNDDFRGFRNSPFSGHGYGMGMHGTYRGSPWNGNSPLSGGRRLSPAEAEEALHDALDRYGEKNWEIAEVMEFESNYYAQIGNGDELLMEVLVDPYTGYVQPEFGPNMMWNTEYGHMHSGRLRRTPDESMYIAENRAVAIADQWLSDQGSPWTVEEHADRFPGYYTIHTMNNGRITGMLSVNGWNGRVWYHDWHGGFLGMTSGEHGNDAGHS